MYAPNPETSPIVKLELSPAADPFNPQYSTKQSVKAFFHFSVKSSKSITLHACVKKMAILSIIEVCHKSYRVAIFNSTIGFALENGN